MKIRFVAFNGLSLTSKVIRFCTRSEWYAHIAFQHSNGKLIEAWGKGNSWKWSSLSNHTKGTPYEVWSLEVTPEQFCKATALFETWADKGLPYDWPGVISFVLLPLKDSKKGKFCSEGAAFVLKELFGWDRVMPERVSPQGFIERLQAADGKREFTGTVGDENISAGFRAVA